MRERYKVSGLIWLILGIGMCVGAVKLKLGDLHKPGPGLVPFLSGVALGVSGLILRFSTISEELRGEEVKVKKIWVEGYWRNLIFILLILFGYTLLLEPLGFLLTAFLSLFFLFKLLHPKKYMMPFVYSGATVVLSYLLFSVWLRVQFPRGILGGITLWQVF